MQHRLAQAAMEVGSTAAAMVKEEGARVKECLVVDVVVSKEKGISEGAAGRVVA